MPLARNLAELPVLPVLALAQVLVALAQQRRQPTAARALSFRESAIC